MDLNHDPSSDAKPDAPADELADADPSDEADRPFESLDDPDEGMPAVDELPFRSWPLPPSRREERYQVVIQEATLEALHAHGRRDTSHEICGILVGNLYQDGVAPYLYIDAVIEGNHAASRNTQVTFTAQTWTHVHELMETQYADRRIVGWYHTHPDFGVFLSDMDLFLHGNFFNLPWQIAIVYDPVRLEDGLFVWDQRQTRRDDLLIATVAPTPTLTPVPAPPAPIIIAEPSPPPSPAPSRRGIFERPATLDVAEPPSPLPPPAQAPMAAAQPAINPVDSAAGVLELHAGADKASPLARFLLVIFLFLVSGLAYICISGGGLESAQQWLNRFQPHRQPPPPAPMQP